MTTLTGRDHTAIKPRKDGARSTFWPVILAGGEGTRLEPFVRQWLGDSRPKQYCAFLGSRTMIEHTWDRALQVGRGEHMVTVIGQGHERYLAPGFDRLIPGKVVEQPRNLGTAAGVLLAATYVHARDPGATVGLFPADHFVYPEDRFVSQIARLFELADQFEHSIVLLGAEPDRPETEYGWIEPYVPLGQDGHRDPVDYSMVMSFHEKPDPGLAREFYRGGFLWNTMVAAVKAGTLLEMGWRLLPDTMRKFDRLKRVLRAVDRDRVDPDEESTVLWEIYRDLEEADFSRDILQSVAGDCIVHRMDGVEWSDWGQPHRIVASLKQFGLIGNFNTPEVKSESHSKI